MERRHCVAQWFKPVVHNLFIYADRSTFLIILSRPTERAGKTQIAFNFLVFEHVFKIKLFEP